MGMVEGGGWGDREREGEKEGFWEERKRGMEDWKKRGEGR